MRPLLASLLALAACSSGVMLSKDGGTGGGVGGGTNGGGSTGGSGGIGLGSPCTISAGGADPCAPAGYACSQGGTCQLPDVDQSCLPDAGCASGGACVQVGTSSYACFQTCSSSSQCADATSSCQAFGADYVCNGNLCGPDVKSAYTSSGPAYYAPCNSSYTDDGYCLPANVPGLGQVGLCFATGGKPDAGLPAACSINRSDAGALCPQGTFCLTNQGTGHGACLPACAYTAPVPDAGASCPAAATCFGGFGGGAEFGVCLASCASQGTCGPGLTCESVPALGADAGQVCAP